MTTRPGGMMNSGRGIAYDSKKKIRAVGRSIGINNGVTNKNGPVRPRERGLSPHEKRHSVWRNDDMKTNSQINGLDPAPAETSVEMTCASCGSFSSSTTGQPVAPVKQEMPRREKYFLPDEYSGKAVITGGSGFLGRSIAKYLHDANFDVFTFDTTSRPEDPNHITGSILSMVDLLAAVEGSSIVFHIAGVLGTTELLYQIPEAVNVNITGTVNVLEACRIAGVKKVFYPTKPNEWRNTYSITKSAGEEFTHMYRDLYGLDARVLRWLNAYGPCQKLVPVRKAVPVMIAQALSERDVEVWGTGKQPVDLIYTEDLAEISAQYALSSQPDSQVRDTGRTVRMEVNQLAELILKLTGAKRSKIKHLPMRAGEDQHKPVELLTAESAVAFLGMSINPKPLEDGLGETIEYYRKLPRPQREEALMFYVQQTSKAASACAGT